MQEDLTRLWNQFVAMREAVLPKSRTLSLLELQTGSKTLANIEVYFGKDFPNASDEAKIRHLYNRPSSELLHKFDCPKFSPMRNPSGWEYRFDGDFNPIAKLFAQRLMDSAPLLREAMNDYSGLWRQRLHQILHSTSAKISVWAPESFSLISQSEVQDLFFTGILDFEILMPGLVNSLKTEIKLRKLKMRIVYEKNGQFQLGQGEISNFFYWKEVERCLTLAISDLRESCDHFDLVECLVCDQYLGPDLSENMKLNLPVKICHWCFKFLDTTEGHQRLVDKSIYPSEDLQIAALKLAVKIFEFRLWKSPIPTREMILALNLKAATKSELRMAFAIIASMPRDFHGYESGRHFLLAVGLGGVLPADKGRGLKSVSSCGHLCLSNGEREICEYLFKNKVPHSREPSYQSLTGLQELTEFGQMRGDFLVGKTVIEFAGLSGESTYDSRIDKKIQLCVKYGLNLIVIKPSQLKNLGDSLAGLSGL
jgi:hypothetical protein